MPTASSHHASPSFWDRVAAKYAKQPIKDPAAYQAKLVRLRALLNPADHVLEVGCGTGGTARELAPHLASITGTDGSRVMIDIAKARLGASASADVTFLVADAADLVSGHPFDAICAFSLLHLVSDIPGVLRSVHDQLRPGGLFISKTVALSNANILVRLFVRVLMAFGVAPPVNFLSTDDLSSHLRAAGFEIEEVGYFTASQTNPFIVARTSAGSSRIDDPERPANP
ncbi:MAG: class I SAM-dependent methyltransferase [Pseudomonadota bacterium]